MKLKYPALLAALCVSAVQASDIVITEIMQNPSAVSDGAGEWFEILNTGATDINLNGWTISDDDSDSFLIEQDVIVMAGHYAVLSNNSDSATNGGVTVVYQYSGMFLANGGDELVITSNTLTEMDRVEWDDGATFPGRMVTSGGQRRGGWCERGVKVKMSWGKFARHFMCLVFSFAVS